LPSLFTGSALPANAASAQNKTTATRDAFNEVDIALMLVYV
jgi:hypothetical protein